MKFHPLSEIFPLLVGPLFDELVEDIRKNGVREPIWTYQNEIIDGRNRYRAAEVAGREAPTREFTGDDPIAFVISMNLRRRHMDESQRAIAATKLASFKPGRPAENGPRDSVSQEKAAELMNVGVASVRRARKVLEKAAPEVVQAVERGELKVNVAAEIADAPKEEQVAAVKEGEQAVKQLRKKVKATAKPSPPESAAEVKRSKGLAAMRHLYDFVVAIEDKTITPKLAVELAPYRFKRDEVLLPFVAKAAKLTAQYYRKLERDSRKRQKKWREHIARQNKRRAALAKKAKVRDEALVRRSAAKLQQQIDARIAKERAAHRKQKRTAARAKAAARRPARRTGDTKQRRRATPVRTRVTRRLSHPSVSA